MSYNNAEVNRVAIELQALTTDPDEVAVRPEAAQAKLVACAWIVRWCVMAARLHQGWLGSGNNLGRVLRVMSRWRRSWRCNEMNASSIGVGALPSTRATTVLTTRQEESSKL